MVPPRLLVACVLVSGCGGSSPVLQRNAAGGDDAADVVSAADAARAPENVGGVQLTSTNATTANPPTEGSTALAVFSPAAVSACPPETIVDGCSLIDCRPLLNVSDAQVSGGSVLVTGTKQPINLTPDLKKTPLYGALNWPGRLWDGGEALQVVVAGDVAPAFTLSLIAPAYVTVNAPVWSTGGAKLSIPRAKDLDVAWSGGGAGKVVVWLTVGAAGGAYIVNCQYPAQSGSGKVSTKVLGSLPTDGSANSIRIESETVVTATVSGWTTTFRATATANAPTGVASAEFVLE